MYLEWKFDHEALKRHALPVLSMSASINPQSNRIYQGILAAYASLGKSYVLRSIAAFERRQTNNWRKLHGLPLRRRFRKRI